MNLVKTLVSSCFLCLFGGYVVNAELWIDVTKTTYGQTVIFDLSKYKRIVLRYNEGFHEDVALQKRWLFKIVNDNSDKELCIQELEQRFLQGCSLIFKYFIGYLPPSQGLSCPDFENKPLCTDYSEVHAVFSNEHSFPRSSVTVEIYLRDKRITTERRIRITTTTYHSTNNNSEGTVGYVSIGIIIVVIICIFVVCIVCIICCTASDENSNERHDQQAHAADAPFYETLFQQPRQSQQQRLSDDSERQTDTGVRGGQSQSQSCSESQSPFYIPLEINLSSVPPADDQHRSTTPPPSYADLDFDPPPAYPGNT